MDPNLQITRTEPPANPVPQKQARGQVFIYGKWCKGCHICVTFCPTGVLAMDSFGEHPIVIHPEACTACHFCDTHCPDLAIVVKRLVG